MTMVSPETPVSPTIESLEAENTRLRARIDALEAEQASTSRGGAGTAEHRQRQILKDETEDMLNDLGDRSRDTLDKLTRGLVYALIESIDATADAISAAAQTAFDERPERRAPRKVEKAHEQIRTSANDVAASVASGLRSALDNPERVVHRFLDAYHDERLAARRRRRGTADKA
jgi:hypothetical protein